MNIYVQERKTGKTTRCIKISHNTGYPILCANRIAKKIIIETAKNLGISIPEPLDGTELIEDGNIPEVIVDELGSILDKCLPFKVIAATHTNFNDHEVMLLDKNAEENIWIHVLTVKVDICIGNKVFSSLDKMDKYIKTLPKCAEILNIQSCELDKDIVGGKINE